MPHNALRLAKLEPKLPTRRKTADSERIAAPIPRCSRPALPRFRVASCCSAAVLLAAAEEGAGAAAIGAAAA